MTQFWDLPEGHLLNLAPMQNYSLAPTALTQLFDMWWFFVSRLEYIMNCLAAGCSQHVPEAYLELVFAPTPLDELQAFRQAVSRAIHIRSVVRVSNNHQLR